jgi:hypothetical protein
MPSDLMENYALEIVLTGWNDEQEWEEVFEEGNPDTVIWDSFSDWDIHSVKNYAEEIVKQLRRAYEIGASVERYNRDA